MTADSSLYMAARRYAGSGWPVFPCDGKVPRTTNGYHDATDDLAQIDEWWAKNPNANIGFAIPAGLLVLDVDTHHDIVVGGIAWSAGAVGLGTLDDAVGGLDTFTWSVHTGGGGTHLYYRVPEDLDVDALRARWDPGVDIKRSGRGYVLLPPSIHPITSREYLWGAIRPWFV